MDPSLPHDLGDQLGMTLKTQIQIPRTVELKVGGEFTLRSLPSPRFRVLTSLSLSFPSSPSHVSIGQSNERYSSQGLS